MRKLFFIVLLLLTSRTFSSECQEKASLVLILKSKDFLEAKGQAFLEEKYSEDPRHVRGNPYSVKKFCESGNPDNDILLNFEYFKRSSYKNCSEKDILDSFSSGDDIDMNQRPISMVLESLKDSVCSTSIQKQSEDLYLELMANVNQRLAVQKTDYSQLCHAVRKGLGKVYEINKDCR